MRRLHGATFKLPLMITCEQFEDFILAYLDDDLMPRQKLVFQMHLMICRECRRYLKAYRAAMQITREALIEDEMLPEDVPADLIAAVIAARDA